MGLIGKLLKGIGLIVVGLVALGVLASIGTDTTDSTDTGDASDQTRAVDQTDDTDPTLPLDVTQAHWEREKWIETYGLITNPTDEWVEDATVTITFLDENGDELGTRQTETFITTLSPGQETPFEHRTPDDDHQVREIRVDAESTPDADEPAWYGDLETGDVTVDQSNDYYWLEGNLTNTGEHEIVAATVHLALFDASGDVFYVWEDENQMPTDLEPGETTDFGFAPEDEGQTAEHRLYTDAAGTYS